MLAYIKGAGHTCRHAFQTRLTFEKVTEAPSSKPGIRCHSSILACVLRIFSNKVVDIRDVDGKVYHLNRSSLSNWIMRNNQALRPSAKNYLSSAASHNVRSFLNEVLDQKSPEHIVRISTLKNELRFEIDRHKRGRRHYSRGSQQDLQQLSLIENLRQQVERAEAERA